MLSIGKEILAELPAVEFPGKCYVIETASKARDASKYLLKLKHLGFDTETRPSFQKGRMYKVSLLQLSTPEECFLFRLNKTGITQHIKNILETPNVTKIGLSTKDDFNALRRLSPDISPQAFLELQSWVKDFQIQDNSLARIYAIIFGQRISKSQRLTNWEAEHLSDSQQQYAAIDAWACLKIYHHLQSGKFDPSESPYQICESHSQDHS